VVFHRGFCPPATETETDGRSVAELAAAVTETEEAPLGGATPLST